MQIVTGYTGTPHITSQQDRDLNSGIAGNRNYILKVGSKLAPTVVSNNSIAIADGVLMIQGCVGVIENGDVQTLTISTGTAGQKRHDLIIAEYLKTGAGVESLDLRVLEGTPAEDNPTDPAYTEQNIRGGASASQVALYRVNIDGLNISSVERLIGEISTISDVADSISGMATQISTLNADVAAKSNALSVVGKNGGSVTLAANARTNVSIDVTRAGYTPLGVVGFDTGAHEFQLYDAKLTNATTAEMRLWNVGSSSVTGTPVLRILYVKN